MIFAGMSTQLKNTLLLLFFICTTWYISGTMKQWMPSKEVVRFEFIGTAAQAEAYLNNAEDQSRDTEGWNSADRLRHATRVKLSARAV